MAEIKDAGGKAIPPSAAAVKAMAGRKTYPTESQRSLNYERSLRPRPVHESPFDYVFRSTNFEMLRKVFEQLQEEQRSEFISALLMRIPKAQSKRPPEAHFPCYQHHMSELPLIAEFCVRVRFTKELLASLAALERPTIGIVTMLLEVEEMIALNFNLFSEQELDSMDEALQPLSEACTKIINGKSHRKRDGITFLPGYESIEEYAKEVRRSTAGIEEQCRKAQYFYLKNNLLQETSNLEVEKDKTKVVSFLASLGFNPLLTASLDRADDLFHSALDSFDWKNCLGHLRSFYEHMTCDGGQALARSLGARCIDRWDPTLTFFRNNSFFTEQQEKFARGLYALLSDEGVHPLIAEREFARLLRNMVIEYGVMFLTMLEKKGVKI